MKQTNLLLLAIGVTLGATTLFLGNSNGAATNGNYYTGAPSAGGGMEFTCVRCHRSGNFGEPSLTVTFAKQDSTDFGSLDSYVPGVTYQVSVAVGYTAQAPAGYGFQSQIITRSGTPPSAAGTLAAQSENTQITAGNAGRTYAEHKQTSNDSVFLFNWTAPEAGTGTVDLYAVGNLGNRMAGCGGDNGSSRPTVVSLTESSPSSVRDLSAAGGKIYPNPIVSGESVHLDLPLTNPGSYVLSIVDLRGRSAMTSKRALVAGVNRLTLGVAELPSGVYTVVLTGEAVSYIAKLVVR